MSVFNNKKRDDIENNSNNSKNLLFLQYFLHKSLFLWVLVG